MMKGKISSIESLGTVDGPGVRYVVFMQGCNLRCLYCHNPETWALDGHQMTISPKALLNKIKKFKPYFGSDGGVTFSGGEPLLQCEFLKEILKLCKGEGINTALDTAGVGLGNYDEILSLVDLIILDIKATNEKEYKYLTGKDMSEFYKFLSDCQKHEKKLWIRQVILPNFNDDEKHILSLAEMLKTVKNIEKIELLPYKTLGKSKYETLNIPYRLGDLSDMDERRCKELENFLLRILQKDKIG